MNDDLRKRLDEVGGMFPEAMMVLQRTAKGAVTYAMRTNLATFSVFCGYGLFSPEGLRTYLTEETLQSSLYILSQPELTEAMSGDPGTWVSPVDLFARGYLMSFELMVCRDMRPDETLWEGYANAMAEHPEQDMTWLHEIVTERTESFAKAYEKNPGPNPISDGEFAEIAKLTEARIGTMFLASEEAAQVMVPQWWQCLIDGTVKGAIAVVAVGMRLSEEGQASLIRRYGCTLQPGVKDDLRIQTTVTKLKDF